MKLDTYIIINAVTEATIAHLAGCSQSAVNKVRNGVGNPTFDLLRRISGATGGAFMPSDFAPNDFLPDFPTPVELGSTPQAAKAPPAQPNEAMASERLVFLRREATANVSPCTAPTSARAGEISRDDADLLKAVIETLGGEQEQAQTLRRAITFALPGPKPKTAFDVFGSDLPDETFEGVFPAARQSGWREVKL